MFKKLLKYDMLSVSRLWWLAAVIVPIASIVGGLLVRFLESFEITDTVSNLIQIGAILLVIACVLAMVLSFVLTMVLVYVRFYKNLFTDEGYLTFTLPVTRKQLLLSKTVNALIWYVLHGILLTVAIVLFFAIIDPEGFIDAVKDFGLSVQRVWNDIGAWALVYLLEFIVLTVSGILLGIALFQFCITVGAIIAKKAKILAAIGIYYAISYGFSMLWQLILSSVIIGMEPGFSILFPIASRNEACGFFALLLLIVICGIGIITMTLYNLTQFMLDRKLNLA